MISKPLRTATFVGALLADLFLLTHCYRLAHVDVTAPLDYASLLGVSQEALGAALAAQEQHNPDLLGRPGVVGTAVGIGLNGRPVVKVYTSSPITAGLPVQLDGIPVLVEVSGPLVALQEALPAPACETDCRTREAGEGVEDRVNPKSHFPRPVPIGVSAGQPAVTAGTIGARVTDGSRVFALSNNHVFAASNAARVGDNILQPGRVDGGVDPTHAIGTLHDFEPIRFCTSAARCPGNTLDAAIAVTSADNLGNATPSNGYGAPRSTTARATLGMSVQKYGRTTGWTTGRVSGINGTVNISYRTATARFVNQIIISGNGFSTGGDSGSLIVTKGSGSKDRRPVGLLFAGSSSTTIANPIDLVLDRFGVTIDGG